MTTQEEQQIKQQLSDPKTQRKAFERIVREYSEPLYWHVRRIVLTHDNANDVMQNVFLKAWTHLDDFHGESKISSWLYRIATNESLNFLQKQKIRAALQFESMTSKIEERIDEDTLMDGDQLQRDLMKAIQRLPSKQRTVFIMRWFDDLSYEDISEILGTSVGALKASYHFASEKIKAELEKNLK